MSIDNSIPGLYVFWRFGGGESFNAFPVVEFLAATQR